MGRNVRVALFRLRLETDAGERVTLCQTALTDDLEGAEAFPATLY